MQTVDENTTLLNEEQTAEILGVKPSTLQRWRSRGWTELPYLKIRYLIRYRLSDVLQFLENSQVGGKAVTK